MPTKPKKKSDNFIEAMSTIFVGMGLFGLANQAKWWIGDIILILIGVCGFCFAYKISHD